jgi:hypothetical protein
VILNKGNSWESEILHWYGQPSEKRSLAQFEALFRRAPSSVKVHLIPELFNVLEASCKKKSSDSLLTAWTNSPEWPGELLYYGYNLLQTPTEGAFLLTEGPFETAAVLLAQKQNIRPDITVINLALLPYPDYQRCLRSQLKLELPASWPKDLGQAIGKIVESNPRLTFYISQNTAKVTIKTLGQPLFCEGLAYRIKKPSYSSFYRLMDNVQSNYNLRYLDDSLSQNIFNKFRAPSFNMAYVPPLLQMFDLYYYRDEKEKAEQWFEKARRIARKAGHEDAVLYHRLFWERSKNEEKPNQIKH